MGGNRSLHHRAFPLRERDNGYLWWINEYPHKERKVKAFFVGGNGGQFIIVVPKLDLVINFWEGIYRDRILLKTQQVLAPEYTLNAIKWVKV